MIKLNNDWDGILEEEFKSAEYLAIREFLKKEYRDYTVYPDMNNIYAALRRTPYKNVKIVLLGQDPYHGAGQAEGLCFSVPEGVEYPPSLVNIFKELKSDLGISASCGSLKKWADNGMLLLNSSLTVREGRPNSHASCGWERFTDKIIRLVNDKSEPVVFLLWGKNARAKKILITNPAHLILEAVHPSPLSASAGFFGCKHFSKASAFIEKHYGSPFDFRV